MIYSVPYIILILTYGILSLFHSSLEDEGTKGRINIACVIIMVFFFGLRGFTCDDWISYYPAFQLCSSEDISLNLFYDSKAKWLFEPGFSALMVLCKSLSGSFHFFTFVCTSINTALLMRFFKKQSIDNIPLGMMLYLCFGGYGMNTNMMRNSIAILLFVNSLQYIERRQFPKYTAACIVATSFHVSALIYFPLYFILHRRFSKWLYMAVFIVCNAIFVMHVPILTNIASAVVGEGKIQLMLQRYTDSMADSIQTFSIGYLERLFTGLLIFCYYNKLMEMRENNMVFINAFVFYFATFFLLSEFEVLSLRISGLFIFAYWVLWNDLIKCFFYENNRKLFMAFVGLYCTMKIVGLTNMITSEYDNVLFGIKSYEERLYIHNRYAKE